MNAQIHFVSYFANACHLIVLVHICILLVISWFTYHIFFQLCYLQASSSLVASMFLHVDPLSFQHQQTRQSALDHLIMVPNYVLYMLVFSYNTYACQLIDVYLFAKNLCFVQARCLLVHLVLLLALYDEIQAKLTQSTSGDGAVKVIISAAESVLMSRPRVSKIQLQLLLDSEKQGRTKL